MIYRHGKLSLSFQDRKGELTIWSGHIASTEWHAVQCYVKLPGLPHRRLNFWQPPPERRRGKFCLNCIAKRLLEKIAAKKLRPAKHSNKRTFRTRP